MGFYVNPPHESKESFLARAGSRVDLSSLNWTDVPDGQLPVVLVDNGMFTAAAIAYSADELGVFADPRDPRHREAFLVSVGDLLDVSEEFARYAERSGIA